MTSGEPVMSTEVGREIELHEFFQRLQTWEKISRPAFTDVCVGMQNHIYTAVWSFVVTPIRMVLVLDEER